MRRSLFILLLVVGCRHAAEEEGDDKPAPATVTCQPVTAAEIADVVEISGVIAPPPKLDSVVSSPVAGRVAQVAVEEGDSVQAGALLAIVEDPALPAGSLEAKAGVASAQAAKTAAEQEVTRQDRLVQTGIGARKDLEDARARLAAANAELDAAKARSGLASSNLARRELRAPRTGIVLHVYKRVGESVDGTSATPIAEVADVRTLELQAQVPPTSLTPLRDGMPATVRVLGLDTAIDASIARVAPAVDSTTLLGLVRVVLAKSEGIKVGTAATAQIAINRRPGVRVPASALRRSLVGEDELVVCEGGVAHVRIVKVGARTEAGVEILDGMKSGERVVVDKALGLEDGQQLVEGAKK